MIEWSFTAADVARIRFAFSPLAELVRSLIVLRAPARVSGLCHRQRAPERAGMGDAKAEALQICLAG
jgi:hypothetical protein